MLVLGDLACPNSKCADLLIADMRKYDLFKEKIILCNLEGMKNLILTKNCLIIQRCLMLLNAEKRYFQ